MILSGFPQAAGLHRVSLRTSFARTTCEWLFREDVPFTGSELLKERFDAINPYIYICKKLQKSVKKNTYENLFSNIWSLMSYLSKTCLIRQQPVNLLNPAVPSFHPLARRPVVQGQLRTPPPWKWLFASGHLPNISEFASSPIYSTRIYYVLTMYVEMERT